ATVNWSQQFNWSAAANATYCLQIASDANFGNIVIEKANLTTNSATVSLSTLDEATTYYWRIVTSQPERLDKPSASATFCTKTRPLAAKTTLVSPDDGAEVEDDFTLVCTKASGVTHYKVQVSAESTFETIKYESSDVVANGSRMNFNLNTALLGKGTFYWRVITSATNCNDNTSDMRSFIITKLSTGAYEPGYVIKKDIDTYSTVDGLKFTNLWMRSIKSEYDNMSFEEDGRMNRGFVVMGDKIYVSGRYSASSSSGTYLQVYSTETGEHLHDIVLGNDASVPYYPCNDVFTDGYGHVLISNLATDAYNQSIFIHMVDTETGNLTEIAEVSLTSTSYGKRIDHCAVYGDVTTGNFCVFAALASGTAIMRWTYRDGSLASSKLTNCSSFYPNGSSFGIAPHIWPLSETMVYVDGGATDFTKYNISSTNGVIDDSFANNVAIAPVDHKGNGGAMFTFKDKNYFVYPYSDETSNEGYRFMLVDNATGTNYSGFGSLQLFPTRGIGNVDSQTWVADCQTVVEGHSYADIFVYVPGNGMAAYRLEPDVKVMMGDVNGDGHINIADVTVLIQKVLGYHPIDFVPANSDLDGDGVYSINDVTLLIIKILE
ncbi:MAG: dockerin type I repeat-containing protein, partial [Muribaculaceae bacterium]|nr:dockerin type I repeat-containing protein [Muribaculaceae bacterium]